MLFSSVVKTFEKISSTNSRLEKTDYLYDLFKECPKEQISNLVYFCKGTLGPKYKTKEMNIGQSIILKIISEFVSQPLEKIKEDLSSLGDVGLVIEKNHKNIKQKTLFSKDLYFEDVFNTFKKISNITGKNSSKEKANLFKSILFNSKAVSAKYLVRFPICFRLGFSDSTIIDALAKLKYSQISENSQDSKDLKDSKDIKNKDNIKELITSKYLIVSDLGLIANILINKDLDDLKNLKIKYFIPIKSQLCERSKSLKDIFLRLSKDENKIFAVDSKIDGFRQQIHKKDNKVKIFTRQEIDVTNMFPDIVKYVKKIPFNFIIDCEAIGYNEEEDNYVPFQITIQRKRKYNISKKSKNIPLHIKLFDILYFKDEIVYNKKFKYRRNIIDNNFNNYKNIEPTEIIYTNDLEEFKNFFNSRLEKGYEGVIAKDLDSEYKAGSRGFSWIKFKKSYNKVHDTIDAYVVGVFYGQGKRTKLGVGAILIALYDSNEDKYYTIAKVGSGFSEDDLKTLNKKAEDLKLKNKPKNLITNIIPDFYIEPKIIVEVNYDEITNSSQHTACYNKEKKQGLALRFPRVEKIRFDKSKSDSLETLRKLYNYQ